MAMLAKEYAAVRIMTPPSCAVAVARDRISAGTGQGGGASHHAARRRRREAFVWGGGQYRKGRHIHAILPYGPGTTCVPSLRW